MPAQVCRMIKRCTDQKQKLLSEAKLGTKLAQKRQRLVAVAGVASRDGSGLGAHRVADRGCGSVDWVTLGG
jgi:hypothetical protein